VGKINKEDWVMKLLAEKFGESQGHTSVRLDIGEAPEENQDQDTTPAENYTPKSEVEAKTFPESKVSSTEDIIEGNGSGSEVYFANEPESFEDSEEPIYYSATATSRTCFIPGKLTQMQMHGNGNEEPVS
jgi:hypothetical protein